MGYTFPDGQTDYRSDNNAISASQHLDVVVVIAGAELGKNLIAVKENIISLAKYQGSYINFEYWLHLSLYN